MSSPEPPPPPLEWKFSQVFGDRSPIEEATEVDVVSTIEFDETGEFIAAGDRGGRVVIFKRDNNKKGGREYHFYAEFQSHEPEFDYLKSLEIEEKINKIRWCKPHANAHFLLTTNDKTIKLWKVFNKRVKRINTERIDAEFKTSTLTIPTVSIQDNIMTAVPRRIFANAHAYHINSIALNSDCETYISADDLRINLWNLSISDHSFNIVDIKPANMEELTEVITSAELHPSHCNILMYSSSKGAIKLGDMRKAALCDEHSKVFEEPEDQASKSFFSEIISSISDIKFSADGRYILARDYLTLKIWDLNMEARPVKTIRIHDHLRSKLCDLYENDCIFDKFECQFSHNGTNVITGSYNNYFHTFEREGKHSFSTEATKSPLGFILNGPGKLAKRGTNLSSKTARSQKKKDENPDNIDFNKKCLHVAWHPKEDVVAVAAANHMYIFVADNPSSGSNTLGVASGVATTTTSLNNTTSD